MKTATILHDATPEDIITKIAGVMKSQLDEIRSSFEPKKPNEYLTRTEVADLLKCDLSTVHNWTVKGKLSAYGIGNRVYYKRAEVESAIKPIS